MTTPETQGEVSPESTGKRPFQPSGARQPRNRPLSALLGTPAEQDQLKPCTGKPFDP